MNKIFEQLLEKRKIRPEDLKVKYEDLADPFLLPDMGKAVERIEKAAKKGEKVLIYGDYDVDGVTASTVMAEALEMAGVREPEIMLPNRFRDGYGMSERVVERAKETGVSLVVTVDCGSANWEIVERLKENGVETIVTDHHECLRKLPEAVAVVNPKRKDAENWGEVQLKMQKKELVSDGRRAMKETTKEEEVKLSGAERRKKIEETGLFNLAGVGVAFKVAQALVKRGDIQKGQEKWLLDLVVIGTICDAMEMTRENHILGKYGMIVLEKTRRKGLKEMLRRLKTKKITAETIGFQIGPRLNAAGRMETAEIALNLLRAKTGVEATEYAEKLEELNKKRRAEQDAAMAEIEGKMRNEREIAKDRDGDGFLDKVIVETGKCSEGVIGIVAGKLVEKYKKPAIVLTEVENGVFKGSGRSFGEFSLAEALKNSENLLMKGGGHAAAAGLTIAREKIPEFKREVNQFYDSLELKKQERFLKEQADLVIPGPGELDLELLDELSTLEPFGEGNKRPIFQMRGARVLEARKMGKKNEHLSLFIQGGDGEKMKLLAFFAPEEWFLVRPGEERDFLIRIAANEWQGVRSVEGEIVEIGAL